MSENNDKAGERLQKFLANCGFGSRREIERWIDDGRITVNNKVATLGVRVNNKSVITLDGKKLNINTRPKSSEARVIIYNKPEGEVCTRKDEKDRRTVFESLPKLKNERWIAIGRLDLNTSGLLLFTTDGELANKLMHPSSEFEREYAVRILGELSVESLKKLTSGVKLEDGIAKFKRIKQKRTSKDSANKWYDVILTEGRNREVRRLFESQGVRVSRLKRVRFGDIHLPKDLKQGQCLELSADDLSHLGSCTWGD